MKTIIANFKMNPSSIEEAKQLLELYKQEGKKNQNVDLIVAPPFLYLSIAKQFNLELAAQNCFYEDQGAFTGEISPLMLKDLGVHYVIIGHSERRQLGETNEMISKKIQAVLRNHLIPILCVGETQQERKEGKTQEVLKIQLEQALLPNKDYLLQAEKIFIAYEPVWAIGTGDFCDPREASETMEFIKNVIVSHFDIRISNLIMIYGGSVDSKNIDNFLKQVEINGVLVGGASIKKEELVKILAIANSY